MSKITDFVKVEADKLAQTLGFYVVDVDYKTAKNNNTLTIYLDKEGGIGLDDLETFSKQIEPVLDTNEAMFNGAYTLNCSSPGLDRALKTDIEFKLALNKELVVKFFKKEPEFKSKEVVGTLIDFNENELILCINGTNKTIDKKTIASVVKNIKF